MVAQQFDQVTHVCEEYSNFQDSESICMISDFKIFLKILEKQLNFVNFSVQQLFYVCYKGKTPRFFNLQFLLLLSVGGFSPKSCLIIFHPEGQLLINCNICQLLMKLLINVLLAKFFTTLCLLLKLFSKINILGKIYSSFHASLRKNCPNTEFFLIRIFLHSD